MTVETNESASKSEHYELLAPNKKEEEQKGSFFNFTEKCSSIINSSFKSAGYFVTKPLSSYGIYVGRTPTDEVRDEMAVGLYQIKELGGVENSTQTKSGNTIYYISLTQEQFQKKHAILPHKWLGSKFNVEGNINIPFPSKTLKEPGSCTVMVCGGNNGLYERSLKFISIYLDRGFNVVCFNYPGYGKSTGETTPESIIESASHMYNCIQQAAGNPSNNHKVLVHAMSLGTGPGTALAREHNNANFLLLLDRPIKNLSSTAQSVIDSRMKEKKDSYIVEIGKKALGGIIGGLFEFDNVEHLKDFEGKVHILSAEDDELLDPSHGEELANACLGDGKNIHHILSRVPGGHGMSVEPWFSHPVFSCMGHKQFEAALEKMGIALVDNPRFNYGMTIHI